MFADHPTKSTVDPTLLFIALDIQGLRCVAHLENSLGSEMAMIYPVSVLREMRRGQAEPFEATALNFPFENLRINVISTAMSRMTA